MPRPNPRDLDNPPREWVKLLDEHGDRVVYLRLLWRRGRRTYMPLIPLENCPGDIYQEDRWEFWEARETLATHFPVKFTSRMSSEARAQLIDEKLRQLWARAAEWARAHGSWCDFELVAYDKHGKVEFQNAKRCVASPATAGRAASSGAVTSADDERTPAVGTIEIVVGKCVFRVWDRDALRMVVDALMARPGP